MKKIFSLLMIFSLLFAFSIPAFAATPDDVPKNISFEISLDEALAKANPDDIQTINGVTTIPVILDVSNEVYTELVITVQNLNRASVKSFSMEGWFRLKSTKEIVTVYGLEGTFEYNGTTATPTGASTYHNSAMDDWTGESNSNEGENDDGSATITGNYTCLHKNKVDNTASCTAKCTKSGSISFSGNYDEATII